MICCEVSEGLGKSMGIRLYGLVHPRGAICSNFADYFWELCVLLCMRFLFCFAPRLADVAQHEHPQSRFDLGTEMIQTMIYDNMRLGATGLPFSAEEYTGSSLGSWKAFGHLTCAGTNDDGQDLATWSEHHHLHHQRAPSSMFFFLEHSVIYYILEVVVRFFRVMQRVYVCRTTCRTC